MHRTSAFALICAITSGLPLMAASGSVRAASGFVQEIVPSDSFIVQHVGSVAQLQQQVSLDPVVRRRLARHFHTSAPAVVRYIQDNLVLKKITVARQYRIYCVGRSGQEYTINSRLAVGTPVFVMRSTGKPILKLACGNPMVASLPPVARKAASYQAPQLAAAAKSGPIPVTSPALNTTGPVVVGTIASPSVLVMPTTRVGGFIGQLPILHSSGGFPFGYLAGIPVLAILAHHSGGNNTGTGTTGTTGNAGLTETGTTGTTGTTGNNTNGNNTLGTTGNNTLGITTGNNTPGTSTGNTGVTAVPEPSTPAAFAVGGFGLLFLLGGTKRRSRRKAH